MINATDSGLLHDLRNVFRHGYYEDKKRGRQNDHMLLGMGACMTAIGVMMSLSAFSRMHPEANRSWSR